MIFSSSEGSSGVLYWLAGIADWLNDAVGLVGRLLMAHGPVTVSLSAAGALGWWWLRRVRAVAMCRDGRQIRVAAPPEAAAGGAEALWLNLHALIRPRWRRAVGDQPHLVFQYAWTASGLTISVWTPLWVPPGMVERAIEAAWPGARTSTEPAADPLPASACCVGGRMRLVFPEWFPLRTDHAADPLRQLLGAAVGLGERDHAVVQILARPVSGRRRTRGYDAAAALRTGRPPPSRLAAGPLGPLCRLGLACVREVLDLLVPGSVQPTRPTVTMGEDPAAARMSGGSWRS